MESPKKMFKLRETLIVEGKYDKIRLSDLLDGNILAIDGFRVYGDKALLTMIRALAAKTGIAILTDSDPAGFQIRHYLTSAIPADQIRQIYIPDIKGKEKRKAHAGKAGLLGVEGMDTATLCRAFEAAGLGTDTQSSAVTPFSKRYFFEIGLSGQDQSHLLREKICDHYGLPKRLSANSLCEVLAALTTAEELCTTVKMIGGSQDESY